ncbi:MAG: DUF547 domain-containing protein [Deltaproteobacteria bacterium]|nr:DUF547 domain-containing protein [Deltaproteobacteria bacterium]
MQLTGQRTGCDRSRAKTRGALGRAPLVAGLAAAIVLSAFAPNAGAEDGFDAACSASAALFAAVVRDDGTVNFATLALKKKDAIAAAANFDELDEDDYAKLPTDEKRAYWINAYNTFVLVMIAENFPIKPKSDSRYPAGSPMTIDGAWHDRKFRTALGKVTLNRIENNILPELGNPMTAFGLANGTRAVPTLAREPYRADTLAAQLDTSATRFFNNPANVKLTPDGRTIEVTNWLKMLGPRLASTFAPQRDQYTRRDKFEIAVMNAILKYHTDAALRETVRKNAFDFKWIEPDWSANDVR